MSELEREWDHASEDPNPMADLDYRYVSINVVAAEQYDRLLLLPEEEDMLKKDAFIVVGEDELVDLSDWV